MSTYRHTFGGILFEIRTSHDEHARAVADVYVVQEGSLLLQPYRVNGDAFVGDTENAARAAAVRELERQFGTQTCKAAGVGEDCGYRMIRNPRTA
jgi:hypothetical protein